MNEIYTLNARGNVMLEVMQSYFNLDSITLYNEINGIHQELKEILKRKKINYSDLKTCLVPSIKKKEMLLVFDSLQIESMWYGNEVFEKILPLFEKNTNHSILSGDFIGENHQQELLFQALLDNSSNLGDFDFQHSTQYYLVYINNISESNIVSFNEKLQDFKAYIGYVDLTYSSFLKTYVSLVLSHTFIKYKSFIIGEHEDDVDNNQNINLVGYNFEKYGFKVKSLQSQYYGLFLSYKIERHVIKEFEKDLEFSLNSITDNIVDITQCKIIIDEKKLDYLNTNKAAQFKKANLEITKEKLILTIKSKLLSNYIYNMKSNEYGNLIFNMVLELENKQTKKFKMLVSLEYLADNKELRLITMY